MTTKRNGPRTPPAWRQLSLITDTDDDDHHRPSADVPPATHRADPSTSALSLDGLPLMLTVSEAAVVLRVSRRTTAYKLADDWRTSGGREGLPVVKLGRRLVVRRVDLAALVGLPRRDENRTSYAAGGSIRSSDELPNPGCERSRR